MRAVFIAICFLLLSACSSAKLEQMLLTPQEQTLVRDAVNDVARGDSASLSKRVPPELAPKVAIAMPNMHRALPPPPFQLSFTNGRWVSNGATREVDAVYEAKSKGAWALVETTLATTAGKTMLTSIDVQQTLVDPQQLNGFSFANASAAGLMMLTAMLAVALITVAALVRIWKSDRFRMRWVWTAGALFGLMTLKMNWTTGAFSFEPISFQFFSLGAVKQPIYAPWVFAVSIPLVALIALFWRGHRQTENIEAEA